MLCYSPGELGSVRGGEPLWVSSMRWPATPWGHAGGTKAEVPPLVSCIASNSQGTGPCQITKPTLSS